LTKAKYVLILMWCGAYLLQHEVVNVIFARYKL